jgi:hypothetical protein
MWAKHCYQQARKNLRLARVYPNSRVLFLYAARQWREMARNSRKQ